MKKFNKVVEFNVGADTIFQLKHDYDNSLTSFSFKPLHGLSNISIDKVYNLHEKDFRDLAKLFNDLADEVSKKVQVY